MTTSQTTNSTTNQLPPSTINLTSLQKQRKQNRQELLELIELDPPFEKTMVLASIFKNLCLYLFDNCQSSFSRFQLTTLHQIVTFATASNVQLLQVEPKGEFEIDFKTSNYLNTVSYCLKVIFNYGQDLYEVEIINQSTGQFNKQNHVHIEDFAYIMDSMKG